MKHLYIWIFVLLALTSFASAQTCYVSTPCQFATVVYNTTTTYYHTSDVNNSLINTNGTVMYSNQSMKELDTGRFVYNYTFNSSGTYLRESVVDGTYIMNEEIQVEDIDSSSLAGLIISNWVWLVLILLGILGLFGINLLNKKV